MKHRNIKQREAIEAGDEIYRVFGWRPVDQEDIGKQKNTLYSHRCKIRRKIHNQPVGSDRTTCGHFDEGCDQQPSGTDCAGCAYSPGSSL